MFPFNPTGSVRSLASDVFAQRLPKLDARTIKSRLRRRLREAELGGGSFGRDLPHVAKKEYFPQFFG
jgi:hypothetical protein